MMKHLVMTVAQMPGGWRATAELHTTDGQVYETAAFVRKRPPGAQSLHIAGDDDDDQEGPEDESERNEAVKKALDQVLLLLDLPYVKAVLPPTVRVTVKAIKAIRKMIETHKSGCDGSIAAGYNVERLGYHLDNPIINSAVRAQAFFE